MPTPWLPSTYGDCFAPVYDEWYGGGDVAPAVETLVQLAGGGSVLELGAGTGRLAVPLAACGVDVDALDASDAMLERLRAKPGGDRVRTTLTGDMADVGALVEPGRYAVVFVAANTFFNLDSREAQARCVAGAARALRRPGGRLVIEAFVPDPARMAQPDVVTVRSIEPDRVVLVASKVDVATQRLETAIVELVDGATGVRVYPARLRWASPDELDALATDAGLALESRWSGWDRKTCDESSDTHVSVWRASV